MNPLLIYMLKAAVYLAGFFIVYRLFLSKDTMYNRNRIYVLLSAVTSLILPFITIKNLQPIEVPIFGAALSEVLVSGSTSAKVSDGSAFTSNNVDKIISLIYISGAGAILVKFLSDIVYLLFLILKQKNRGSNIIEFQRFDTAGFSALGHIFINKKLSSGEAVEIINHEQNHLDKNHFIDIIFIELIKVFQWFNPFIYFFDRSLRAIHEYQADEGCLHSGILPLNYQNLILNQVFKSKIFRISNSFSNPSLIKKRMIMMTKKRSNGSASLKLLLVLPVMAFLMFAISSCAAKKKAASSISSEIAPPPPPPPPPEAFVVVEEMPQFPGGTESLLKHIADNTQYPREAKEKGIQGKVIVRMIVNKDGTVSNTEVIKGVDPLLDAEAVRVVSSIPEFTPGKQGGVPVAVYYMVPITFSLSKSSKLPAPPVEELIVVKEDPQSIDTEPFVVVEEMPMFPGGEMAMLKYIAENTHYPDSAKVRGIQGRVIIRFAVDTKGEVTKETVLKGVDPDLDAEALRVVKTLPQFQPGKQGGKLVPVWYMVPITFTLR